MKRRDIILAGAALATGGGVAGVLAGKEKREPEPEPATADTLAKPNINRGIKQFRLATSWPKDFPGLGIMPERFADSLRAMSDGLLDVKVYAAGELVGALQCFDSTSRDGGADMYHAAEYYWQGKSKAFSFFTAVPLGMTAAEIMGWVEFGGGQALWDELSARFNIKAFHAGNTGHQTGGWFKKKINTIDDFKGLRMRMPGLGGEVIRRLGGTAKQLPGGEIYQALQSGNIDATEWVGPWNDLAFGFYREAPYYYAPGFHEPGAALAVGINLDVWNGLTSSEQAMIKIACKAANDSSLGEYTHMNSEALNTLKTDHGIFPQFFSAEVAAEIGRVSDEVVKDFGSGSDADDITRRVYASYRKARDTYRGWTEMSEGQYIRARQSALGG